MKRIMICILCIVVVITSNAQTILPFHPGANTQELCEPTITKTVQGQTATYTFNVENASQYLDTIGGTIYSSFTLRNSGEWYVDGSPNLPTYYELIEVSSPNANVSLVASNYTEINNVDVYPSQPMIMEEDTISIPEFFVDSVIYSTNTYITPTIVEKQEIQEFRGRYFIKVAIYPIRYNPAQHKIRCYNQITYTVTDIKIPVLMDDGPITNVQDDYFIVCVDSMLSVIDDFVEWKRKQGFNVHIISKSNWISCTEVKASIKTEYENSPMSSRKFLLIIGNASNVPPFIAGDFVTDYNYSCMDDSTDITRDIAVGRIPCANTVELQQILNKTITYQAHPAFTGKAINLGEFEKSSYSQTAEQVRIIRTSEDVKNYTSNLGFNTTRVYYADSITTNVKYNYLFSDGNPFPNEILNKHIWEGNRDSINYYINNLNPNYIIAICHGTYSRWSNFDYNISDVNSLHNTILPVVLSVSCSIGQYAYLFTSSRMLNQNCLAYSLLAKLNGGAAAVIASTSPVQEYVGCLYVAGWFDTMFPNPGLNICIRASHAMTNFIAYKNDFTVGNALNGASEKLRNHYQTSPVDTMQSYSNMALKAIWSLHCFGDPSTELYTGYPTDLSVVEAKQVNDSIIIDTHGIQDCKVVLIPKDHNQHSLFMMADSVSGRFAFPNITIPYDISIQKHNCPLHYIDSYDVYLQDIELASDAIRNYEGNRIFVGKDVTDDTEQGAVIVHSGANITLDGQTSVEIKNNFEVELGSNFEIK